MTLQFENIYPRLRNVLSEAKGARPPPDEIKYDMELSKPPLSFKALGKRSLSKALSAEFELRLEPDDVERAKYVKDLAKLVHNESAKGGRE